MKDIIFSRKADAYLVQFQFDFPFTYCLIQQHLLGHLCYTELLTKEMWRDLKYHEYTRTRQKSSQAIT